MSWHRFFRRRRADAELMAEMESYMTGEIAENVARGIPEEEAMRRARIRFGNPAAVRETLWQQNTVTIIDNFWRDLRYATRTLTRAPGFATIAILVMALGIGANVALFTIVRSVLLNPLPFTAPNQLVALYAKADTGKGGSVAASDFYDWQSQSHSFEQMAIWRWTGYTWQATAASFRNSFRPSHAHGTCFQPWASSPLWAEPSFLRMMRTRQLPR